MADDLQTLLDTLQLKHLLQAVHHVSAHSDSLGRVHRSRDVGNALLCVSNSLLCHVDHMVSNNPEPTGVFGFGRRQNPISLDLHLFNVLLLLSFEDLGNIMSFKVDPTISQTFEDTTFDSCLRQGLIGCSLSLLHDLLQALDHASTSFVTFLWVYWRNIRRKDPILLRGFRRSFGHLGAFIDTVHGGVG